MDEEVITWNLKGPKRFKKRKELNALIRNNMKYKSGGKQGGAAGGTSIDMYNINAGGSSANRRLLRGVNDDDSSNLDDTYYFSANKQIIKEKNRRRYCKMLRFFLIGCSVTFALITAAVLFMFYSNFHSVVDELRHEMSSKNYETIKSLDTFRNKLDEHDRLLKQSLNKAHSGEEALKQQVREKRNEPTVSLLIQKPEILFASRT